MDKKILINKTTETRVHVSLHVPTIVQLDLEITRKSDTNHYGFFKHRPITESTPLLRSKSMSDLLNPKEDEVIARI